MTTDLAERLDQLAAIRTEGLELRHPDFPGSVTPIQNERSRAVLLLVASVAAVVLIGGWWITQRQTANTLEVAGNPVTQPTPALLLEELTPLSELPAVLRVQFEDARQIPPLDALNPDAPAVEFTGVHIIEQGDVTVAVGLDTTGRVLCVAETTSAVGTTSSSCGTPAGFAAGQSMGGTASSPEGNLSVFFVGNDVAVVELGALEAPVGRNVAIIEDASGGVPVLRRADGTVAPGAQFPDPSANGELSTSFGDFELAQVGCSIVAGDVLVEATFLSSAGVLTGVVTPDGVYLNGGVGDEAIVLTPIDVAVERSTINGTLVVTANWQSDGSGSLRADCGDHLIDLSDIR